jgi:hypothetical protein
MDLVTSPVNRVYDIFGILFCSMNYTLQQGSRFIDRGIRLSGLHVCDGVLEYFLI